MTVDEARRTHGLGANYRRVFAASTLSNLGDGVGAIAYPWLASAVTRNPALIAAVVVVQRLPWLVFSLPAGVITDRVDRRRAMIAMDVCRAAVTLAVAFAVLGRQGSLPTPDALDRVVGTDALLYGLLLLATLLLGLAEVLRDNSAQTILPAIVPADRLEQANGQMWSAETVTNTFLGPPLGSVLLIVAFSLPFFLHATTFAVAAALMATVTGSFGARPTPTPSVATTTQATHVPSWRADLAEGVRWLWGHPLLRTMAIILGLTNAAGMMFASTFVLFAQEVLGVGPFLFSVIGFGGATGGIIGGLVASRVSARFGPGPCLTATLAGGVVVPALIGVSSHWAPVLVLFGVTALLAVIWNVITVSLRQAVIPSHLLGRVNSVYRFFAWGMLPIGAAVGGGIVVVVEQFASREAALRAPWLACAAIHVGLVWIGRRHLTTAAIESARAEAAPDVSRPGDGATG